MASDWYVSCPVMTVFVRTHGNGVIYDAAPIVARWKNQPFWKLLGWMRQRFGEVTWTELAHY